MLRALAVTVVLLALPGVASAAPLKVGEVQGPVPESADGATHASPVAGQTVEVRGVVAQKLLGRTSAGQPQYGFFLQSAADDTDGDPLSSDGIYVFQSRFPDLIGGYVPTVGDEVVISGRVSEFFNMTQLSSARLVTKTRSGVPVPAPFDANPPDDAEAAERYWERREGMQGRAPAQSLVVDGRDTFPSTADGEVWLARPDAPIAKRSDRFARRVFRDPHPLDNRSPLFDDGNGYRILLGSMGVKATAGDQDQLIAPARTFQRVTNAPTGGVYYAFSKYSLQPAAQPRLAEDGPRPDRNAPPQPPRRSEFQVAIYNVENLYDFRDDPTDGCDFAGNAGCPGVRPPFDYVPADEAEYRSKLSEQARQIVRDLHSPDIVLTQEAEDQDICTVRSRELRCDQGGDGRPDTLQELALEIARRGGPEYLAAADRDGADDRGIISGFLYRRDRVEAPSARGSDPVLGDSPRVRYRSAPDPANTQVSNPKALNAELPADLDRSTGVDGNQVFTRAPQVGRFRVWSRGIGRGRSTTLYAVSNHFSSTPNARVDQRREQAAYNAAIYRALAEDRRRRVVVGGDLNVFPRPDDPFAPGQAQFPSDQLASLYDAGLRNMFDVQVRRYPAAAYTYVFGGQAQTLDHQFLSPKLFADLSDTRVAHINADWPADEPGDGARGASDHDPVVSRIRFPD